MFQSLYVTWLPSGHLGLRISQSTLPPVRRSPMSGKYSFSAWVVTLLAAAIILCLVLSSAEAYRICTFKGTVLEHGWRSMTVKSGTQCAEVNVGWRTKYLPNRRPCIGERV